MILHSPPTIVAQVRISDPTSCGLSLLLVLILTLRVFRQVLWFSPSTKTNISKFKFDLDTVQEKSHFVSHLFYFYFVLLFQTLQAVDQLLTSLSPGKHINKMLWQKKV